MRRPAVLLAVLAACLLLPSASHPSSRPPTLAQVATWLAQRPVYVECLTKAESENDLAIALGAEAYVNIAPLGGGPDDHTIVAYPWCGVLRDLRLHGRDFLNYDSAAAVLILTHESGHLRGASFPTWYDEAIVNCWALRRSAAVAVIAFGMPESEMPAFQKILNGIYRHQPPEYQKGGCVSDG